MSMLELTRTNVDSSTIIRDEITGKSGHVIWKIRFSLPLDPVTVNTSNMYVTDAGGTVVKTAIKYNTETNYIEIKPLSEYSLETDYYLNITKNVMSVSGKNLKHEVKLLFKIKP